MKHTFLAALLSSVALLSSTAFADESTSKQIQVGIDTGLMQVGPNPTVMVNRFYIAVPLIEREKVAVKWESANLLIGDPNYRTYTTGLNLDLKTKSGIVFEGRIALAKVSTTVTESSMAGTTTSTVSTTASAYGVGVRYQVEDVTISVRADVINGYQPSYSFIGGLTGDQQAHLVTVGAAYSF